MSLCIKNYSDPKNSITTAGSRLLPQTIFCNACHTICQRIIWRKKNCCIYYHIEKNNKMAAFKTLYYLWQSLQSLLICPRWWFVVADMYIKQTIRVSFTHHLHLHNNNINYFQPLVVSILLHCPYTRNSVYRTTTTHVGLNFLLSNTFEQNSNNSYNTGKAAMFHSPNR